MLKRLFDYFRCDLAVDLGTANTLVGVAGEGVVLRRALGRGGPASGPTASSPAAAPWDTWPGRCGDARPIASPWSGRWPTA